MSNDMVEKLLEKMLRERLEKIVDDMVGGIAAPTAKQVSPVNVMSLSQRADDAFAMLNKSFGAKPLPNDVTWLDRAIAPASTDKVKADADEVRRRDRERKRIAYAAQKTKTKSWTVTAPSHSILSLSMSAPKHAAKPGTHLSAVWSVIVELLNKAPMNRKALTEEIVTHPSITDSAGNVSSIISGFIHKGHLTVSKPASESAELALRTPQ